MKFLQFIMTIVIMAFGLWISAIMFGPWAIVKYAEKQFGELITLHNVTVSSKLDAKINRIDFNHDTFKSSSIRGIEFRWSIISGKPKLMIDVSSANFEDQYSLSNIYVEINKSDNKNNYPIAINAVAEKLEALGFVNVSNVEAKFLTNLEFSEFSNFKSTSGNLEMTGLFDLQSDGLEATADVLRLNGDVMDMSDEILIHLEKVTSVKFNADAEKIIGKIIPNDQFFDFAVEVAHARADKDIFSSEKISALGKYDIISHEIVEGIFFELEQAELLGRKIVKSKSKIDLNEGLLTITSEGILESTEINLGGQYIGNLPSSEFNLNLKSEALDKPGEFAVALDLVVQTDPEVDISVKSSGMMSSSNLIDDCFNSKCDFKDIILEYSIQSEGHQMSGKSECYDINCSSNSSRHDISTSDTNQFFQKMQETGMFNPFILGLAYSQMLGGLPEGSGHKLSF